MQTTQQTPATAKRGAGLREFAIGLLVTLFGFAILVYVFPSFVVTALGLAVIGSPFIIPIIIIVVLSAAVQVKPDRWLCYLLGAVTGAGAAVLLLAAFAFLLLVLGSGGQ